MRIAIVGYGKMGRMIDGLAAQAGAEIVARLDIGWTDAQLTDARPEAAIEFSSPEAAVHNLERLAALRVATVVGTTGWLGALDRVRAAFDATGTPMIYSANYSIGVNVFQRLVAEASRLLADETAYEAWAWEIHHSAKKDAPSGTLLQLVRAMRAAGYQRTVSESSNRAGAHPGTHEIGFDSAADTITLRHSARNREGFARGALKAALMMRGGAVSGVREFSEILFGGGTCS